MSGTYSGPFLAGYEAVPGAPQISYGLQRLDHAVGNAHQLLPTLEYIVGFTGELCYAMLCCAARAACLPVCVRARAEGAQGDVCGVRPTAPAVRRLRRVRVCVCKRVCLSVCMRVCACARWDGG